MTSLNFTTTPAIKKTLASLSGYKISGDTIYYGGAKIAEFYRKHRLYKQLLQPHGIEHEKIVSKKLLPLEAIFVLRDKILHIIDTKFLKRSSFDWKLQTCDFKNKQYAKLLAPLGISVKYTYILSDWFKDKSYRDVLGYITSVGCYYFFNELPLDFLGLPRPKA